MGTEWLQGILEWVRQNPSMAGLVVCAITFLEGLALIGIIIPGIIILFGFGALVGIGVLDIWTLWFWSSLGAILGDGASFWIGYHFRGSLREIWPFSRFETLIDRGVAFFRRHGLKSVVIGRFVGPVRPIMPVVAGMMMMPLKRYIPANIIAGILWAPAYFLPGVVFGASIELAKAVAFRLALLVGLLVALFWSVFWLVRRVHAFLAPRTSSMLSSMLAWSKRHPLLGRPAANLVDPRRPDSGTLLLFALLLTIAAWGLATALVTMAIVQEPLGFDRASLEAMNALRSPWADQLMVVLLGLGSDAVLLPAAAVVVAWLLIRGRRSAAAHWAAAVGVGWVLAIVFGQFVLTSRPGQESADMLASLPHVHVAMAVVVYGFFAVLISRELPGRPRVWPYIAATLAVALLGFAQAYLGLRWISDLIVGGTLGILWTTIIGIAYRTHSRRSFWIVPVSALFFISLGLCAVWFAIDRAPPLAARLQPVMEPVAVDRERWRSGGWTPRHEAPVPLNLQFAGDLDMLKQALLEQGWQTPPEAGWGTLFKLLQPHPTAATLPPLPAAYHGRGEALTLIREVATSDSAVPMVDMVRIWSSEGRIDGATTLWIGSVARYELRRVAWFFSFWDYVSTSLDDNRDRLAPGFSSLRVDAGIPTLLIQNPG